MSANEIIEAIKKRSREEQQQVLCYLQQLKKVDDGSAGLHGVSAGFDRVVDKVFKKHEELFGKLAQ